MNKLLFTIAILGLILTFGCIDSMEEAEDYYKETSFGEMNAKDTTITFPFTGIYYPITDMNAGHLRGFSSTDGNLIAHYDGNYLLTSQWSFSGGANTEYHISFYKNGTTQLAHCHAERKIGTGGDVGSASVTCIEPLNAGDYICMSIENATNTQSADIHDATTNITRLSN